MVGRIGQALGLRMVRSGTTSKQHQSTNDNGGDTWRHPVRHTLLKIVITRQQSSINDRRHPRTTTSLELFAIMHPYGSSEVATDIWVKIPPPQGTRSLPSASKVPSVLQKLMLQGGELSADAKRRAPYSWASTLSL